MSRWPGRMRPAERPEQAGPHGGRDIRNGRGPSADGVVGRPVGVPNGPRRSGLSSDQASLPISAGVSNFIVVVGPRESGEGNAWALLDDGFAGDARRVPSGGGTRSARTWRGWRRASSSTRPPATPGPTPSSSRSASCRTARTSAAGSRSNLFSTFNSKSSLDGKWENVILQAAQVWAQQTNINFAVVPDDGAAGGLGRRRAGQSRVRRHPDRRLQLRLLHPRPDLSAAAGQQLLDRRRHDVQHRPVVQHRLDLRPVHRGDARVRPRAGPEREQRQRLGDVRDVHRPRRPAWPATTSRASAASTAATARARRTRTTPTVRPTAP